MAEFYLRDIPDPLWLKVKRQATKDGRTLKWLFLRWLTEYVQTAEN